MLVERRLRQGFHRNADVLDPEVDRFLSTVVQRTRRRVIVHRAVAVVAIAAVAVGVFAYGPRVLEAFRGSKVGVPATTPSDSAPPRTQTLTGTFTRRVDLTSATPEGQMAGRWTVALQRNGRMKVHAPASFAGFASGYLFRSQGRIFRTNLFGQDPCTPARPVRCAHSTGFGTNPLVRDPCTGSRPGTYRWSRSGKELTFKTVDDQCEARVELFTSGLWMSVP